MFHKLKVFIYHKIFYIGSVWKTRDGRTITIYEHGLPNSVSALVGKYYDETLKFERPLVFFINGRYFNGRKDPRDLVKRLKHVQNTGKTS